MKRALVLVLSIVLLLSACSSMAVTPAATSGSPAATTVAPATDAPTPTLAVESASAEATTVAPTPTSTPAPPPSLTTGLPSLTEYKPICIMIENQPAARPLSGIGDADIVYEALMEGRSMTRFMCVFNDKLPQNVGPVRSCRLYFLELAKEYRTTIAFFGGPTFGNANIMPALNKAVSNNYLQLYVDGISSKYGSNSKYKIYWRNTKTRQAPHNVYSDLTKISALLTPPADAASHFRFNSEAVLNGDEVNNIEIQYTRKSVDTKYVYDAATGKYKRFVSGEPMIDANTKEQIAVTNIIIQYAKTYSLNTSRAHINIKLEGTGDADVFYGGRHIKATWKRAKESDITRFYDESGNEITLLPGNTWVQEVPTGGSVPVIYSK